MKSETANEKKTGFRFNYIDVILILVILAVIGVIAYVFLSGKADIAAPEVKTVDVVYEVEVRNTLQDYRGLIHVGDTVVNSLTNEPVGTVTDVVYSAAKFEGTAKDGTKVYSDYPDHISVIVKIRATVTAADNGAYSIGGAELLVGKTLYQHTPAFVYAGTCISVKEDTDHE